MRIGLNWIMLIVFSAACTAAPAAQEPTNVPPTAAPTSTLALATATEAPPPVADTPTRVPDLASPTPEPAASPTQAGPVLSGVFVKEEVDVTGSYTLDVSAGVLRFSDDFDVRPGPDLFVILSAAHDLTLDYVAFSRQVTGGALLTLGPLAQTSGAQQYVVPAGTDLSAYNTVVIWCQSFSVAFAAAPLAP